LIGIGSQIVEFDLLIIYFPIIAVGAAPYMVLMRSESTPTWDKYQIAVPIKRKELASSLYLNVFIASLLGIPIIGIVRVVGYVLNGGIFTEVLTSGYINIANVYGIVFFTTAFLYPLGLSRLGQRSTQGVFFGSIILSTAVTFGLYALGNNMGLSEAAQSLMVMGISGIAFAISLFITRAIFAKTDF